MGIRASRPHNTNTLGNYTRDDLDYGFDLPDCREEYIDTEGANVRVIINRHWYQPDDEESDHQFKVSFSLERKTMRASVNQLRGGQRIDLPIGTDESLAITIAKILWEEDEEATQKIQDMRAEREQRLDHYIQMTHCIANHLGMNGHSVFRNCDGCQWTDLCHKVINPIHEDSIKWRVGESSIPDKNKSPWGFSDK